MPRERVQALLFSTELARGRKPRSSYRQLVLTNGARLSVRTRELAGDDIRATTLTGASVRIPMRALAAINVYNGPAVYLSDLTPQTYEHTPYLGVRWPLANDHSVAGGDLRLGGGDLRQGHRHAQPQPRDYARFRRGHAVRGGRRVGRRYRPVAATCTIQVLADGKPLLDLPVGAGRIGDPPKPLRLPLPAGAKELTLFVDFGRGGDVQDHVDWADARIIVGGPAAPLNAGRNSRRRPLDGTAGPH